MNPQRKLELARSLVDYLTQEARSHGAWVPPDIAAATRAGADFQQLWLAFRSLVNVRPPWPADPEFLMAQNELLEGLIEEAGVHTIADAEPSPADERIRLWRGDITTLGTDAIVNAANSQMTGCWQPLHYCIDNAIHTFAGVQLRAEMACIMDAQGHEEPTGHAKITSAYNLPSKHIIHTVGPIAQGRPTDTHCLQLAQSYRACMDTAHAHDCLSIGLCCISTGVFGFPQDQAAAIALSTVREWYAAHPKSPLITVFNVFGDVDEQIYRRLLNL